jgi:hypothetical protein
MGIDSSSRMGIPIPTCRVHTSVGLSNITDVCCYSYIHVARAIVMLGTLLHCGSCYGSLLRVPTDLPEVPPQRTDDVLPIESPIGRPMPPQRTDDVLPIESPRIL